MANLTREELLKIAQAAGEIDRRKRDAALDFYKPYPKQAEFHALGATKRERLLMAANRFGKSECGAAETAMHLTGRYPADWPGRKFPGPVQWWASSDTGLTTRDVVQTKLCGQYGDRERYGTGMIPRDAVDWDKDVSLARGVTDAFDTVLVRHVSGAKSTLAFKTYEQGRAKWQGKALDGLWCDEEPPEDIYAEGLTRTATAPTGGMGMAFITFTPLMGYSKVVERFLTNPSPECGVVTATIEDALHFTAEERRIIVAGYLPHQRDARSKGIPMLGSGAIFPYAEETIAVDRMDIPPHWALLWGLDFGITHPFAGALIAWDRDADIVYVIGTVRMKDSRPIDHAAAMKPHGLDIPASWPHDGSSRDKGSGETLASQYKKHGVKMQPKHAHFKDGSISTEAGLMSMIERITTGRLKVFRHLNDWWEEYRLYHRKDGIIVAERDDLMSATRTAIMDLRHARPVRFLAQMAADGRRREQPLAAGVDFDPFTGQ